MPLRIVIRVGVQVKTDHLEAVLPVKRDRVLVAGLRFEDDHPRARCRRFLYGEQYGSDAATAPRVLEHADIAYQEAVVPSLRRALDIADQLPALKRAECCRLLKLLAEEHIVERPFFGFAEGRVLHTEAAFASADVIIALRLIARGELPSGVFFSFQALDLHSFSPSSSVGLKHII